MKNVIDGGIFAAAHALRDGIITSRSLTEYFLNVIEEKDGDIGAFLYVDRSGALASADKADTVINSARENGTLQNLSPLCGIPCAVKDNIAVKGIPCTCGSKILSSYIPTTDATVIKRLKECGAVILGKTNLDEFAMGSSTEKSAYKITKNPIDTSRTPGGSSGGSAAALCAGMCVYALGSDTGGSVRLPASYCGVYGFKPTWGALSRSGLIHFAPAFDAIGVLALSAEDCKAVFTEIMGTDPLDATTHERKVAVAKPRIGIIKELFDSICPSLLKDRVGYLASQLSQRGYDIVDVSIPAVKYAPAIYNVLGFSQSFTNLARFDGLRYGSQIESDDLEELYTNSRGSGFGTEVKSRILFGAYVLKEGYEKYYIPAENAKELLLKQLEGALYDKCDFFLSPTAYSIAPKLLENSSEFTDRYTVIANIAGLPAVSLPDLTVEHMPIGIQLMGRKYSDFDLLDFVKEVQNID